MPSFLPYSSFFTPQPPAHLPNIATMSDAELVHYVENMNPRRLNRMMKRISVQSAIRTVVDDTEIANRRRANETPNRVFDYITRNYQNAADVDRRYGEITVGQAFTTHPQHIPTLQEDRLLRRYAHIIQSDAYNSRGPKNWWANIRLAALQTRLRLLPLYSNAVKDGLQEARLKYQPIANNVDAAVTETIKIKQRFVTHYPVLDKPDAKLFNTPFYQPTSWLTVDADRGKVTPKQGSISARDTAKIGFNKQIAELQNARNQLPAHLRGEMDALIQTVRNTATERGASVDGWWHKLKRNVGLTTKNVYLDSSLHIEDLKNLQKKVPRKSNAFWAIERAIERTRISPFNLITRQPRIAGEVVDDIMDAFIKQRVHKNWSLSEMSDARRFVILDQYLDRIKELKFNELDFSHLPEGRRTEVQKTLAWFRAYKDLQKLHGRKFIPEVIIANTDSVITPGFTRLIAADAGLNITGPDAFRPIPLVETKPDIEGVRAKHTFLQEHPNKVERVFGNKKPFIMLATSDTGRTTGSLPAFHAMVGKNIQQIRSGLDNYNGTGDGFQRAGQLWPDQVVHNAPKGVRGYLHTAQSVLIERANRTQHMASANMRQYLNTFLGRAFGMGGNPDASSRRVFKALADESQTIFANMFDKTNTFNTILTSFSTKPFQKALNPGSRGSIGFPETLSDMLKPQTREASRAIGLSRTTMLNGNPYTNLWGHPLHNFINQNPEENIRKLHVAYKHDPHVKVFIKGMLNGLPVSDTGILQQVFKGKLSENIQTFLNYQQADYAFQKKYLPQIIDGPNTTRTWQDFHTRMDLPTTRFTRAAALVNLKRVLNMDPNAKLFRSFNLGPLGKIELKNFAFLPKQGKTFVRMMNSMAAFYRVIRSGG